MVPNCLGAKRYRNDIPGVVSHTARLAVTSTPPSTVPLSSCIFDCAQFTLLNTNRPYVLHGPRVSCPCPGGPRCKPSRMGWSGRTSRSIATTTPPPFRCYLYCLLYHHRGRPRPRIHPPPPSSRCFLFACSTDSISACFLACTTPSIPSLLTVCYGHFVLGMCL